MVLADKVWSRRVQQFLSKWVRLVTHVWFNVSNQHSSELSALKNLRNRIKKFIQTKSWSHVFFFSKKKLCFFSPTKNFLWFYLPAKNFCWFHLPSKCFSSDPLSKILGSYCDDVIDCRNLLWLWHWLLIITGLLIGYWFSQELHWEFHERWELFGSILPDLFSTDISQWSNIMELSVWRKRKVFSQNTNTTDKYWVFETEIVEFMFKHCLTTVDII